MNVSVTEHAKMTLVFTIYQKQGNNFSLVFLLVPLSEAKEKNARIQLKLSV